MGLPEADRKFPMAVATALAFAYVALAQGDRVMIRVLAGEGKAATPGFVYGRHRIVELAQRLGAIRPAGELDLATALARELVSVRRAGKVFVISDYLMMINSVTRGLGLFTAANMDVTAVQILGGSEMAGAGLTGDVELVDAESGERVMVSIGNRERDQYRQTLARLCARDQNILPAPRPALHALHHRPEFPRLLPARDRRLRPQKALAPRWDS